MATPMPEEVLLLTTRSTRRFPVSQITVVSRKEDKGAGVVVYGWGAREQGV